MFKAFNALTKGTHNKVTFKNRQDKNIRSVVTQMQGDIPTS